MTLRRHILVAIVLSIFLPCFAAAQEQLAKVRISVEPAIDIPLRADSNLFRPSAGSVVNGLYAIPGFRLLSAGVAATYHAARMQRADLGDLGSLSIFSGEAMVEVRTALRVPIDLYVTGSAGFFYAFENGEPASSASNLVWSTGVGLGVRATPALTVGVRGEYRSYQTIYQFVGIGIVLDLRFGNEGK
jgi:hypothetical protein